MGGGSRDGVSNCDLGEGAEGVRVKQARQESARVLMDRVSLQELFGFCISKHYSEHYLKAGM
jgi:hypothetical protein